MIMLRSFVLVFAILNCLACTCTGQSINRGRSTQSPKSANPQAPAKRSTIAKWSMNHMSKLAGNRAPAYNLMQISKDFGALLAMYEYTDSIYYLEDAFEFTLNLISKTKEGKQLTRNPASYRDNYKGWVNVNKSVKAHRNGGIDGKEIVLFESYFLRYVSKMLYMASRDNLATRSRIIAANYSSILFHLEKNGWEKWYNRGLTEGGCFKYLFRNRTHMAAHWATIALYLKEIGVNKSQYDNYNAMLNMFDKQLRSNLKVTNKGAYIWNMTWDKAWPYGLNCNPPASKSIVQDVDHGNHVISYIIEAYEMNHEWKAIDIQRFAKTVETILYNSNEKRFYSSLGQDKGKDYTKGIRMADGFLKLARYNKSLLSLFEKVKNANEKSSKLAFYKLQYHAELMLAESYHK